MTGVYLGDCTSKYIHERCLALQENISARTYMLVIIWNIYVTRNFMSAVQPHVGEPELGYVTWLLCAM